MRWVPAVLLLVLVAPSVGAAPFLQQRYDAARTGDTPDPGPGTHDIALVLELPGHVAPGTVPIILGDHVYVLTTNAPALPAGDLAELASETALLRLDVTTGAFERLATDPRPVSGSASDGTLLFTVLGTALVALSLEDGAIVWETPLPAEIAFGDPVPRCAPPAVEANELFLACAWFPREAPHSTLDDPQRPLEVLATLASTDTGELSWVARPEVYPYRRVFGGTLDPGTGQTRDWVPSEVALIGDLAVVTARLGAPNRALTLPARLPWGWALERTTGEVRWEHDAAVTGPEAPPFEPSTLPAPSVTGYVDRVFIKDTLLFAYASEGGFADRVTVTAGVPGTDNPAQDEGTQLAMVANTVLVAGRFVVVAYDRERLAELWRTDSFVDPGRGRGMVVAGRTAYFSDDGESLIPLDLDERVIRPMIADQVDGSRADVRGSEVGVGEGLLVALSPASELTIIGEAPSGIGLGDVVIDRYPPVGEPLVVNLSTVRPGVQSEVTEFRVDWGDGAIVDWTIAPVHEHTYGRAGPALLRLEARNAVGQRSALALTLEVGGAPPVEPNAVERAFARQNQDLTFGIFGVLVALTGGAIGITRVRARRSRLRRELDAIAEAARLAGNDPVGLRAAMEERRAHARGLLLEARLEEHQVATLERTIDHTLAANRHAEIEARLAFLPHGMVRQLEQMLADGRIETWEHHTFVTLLEAEGSLSAKQKRSVRALIDRWFAEDKAG